MPLSCPSCLSVCLSPPSLCQLLPTHPLVSSQRSLHFPEFYCRCCRILVPRPGMELLRAPSPKHWTARELPRILNIWTHTHWQNHLAIHLCCPVCQQPLPPGHPEVPRWVDLPRFLSPHFGAHLGFLQFGTITNKAAVRILRGTRAFAVLAKEPGVESHGGCKFNLGGNSTTSKQTF